MNRHHIAVFVLLLFTSAVALADQAPIISPFATARPVVARHGMVVSQEAVASRIGVDVLRRGGNAVDAAVAVGFASRSRCRAPATLAEAGSC